MAIQIDIVDDHPVVISGLLNIFSHHSNIQLNGTYHTAAQLLQGLERSLPDVLLLDIQLPDQTGDKLALTLLKKYPNLKILALTNIDSVLYVNNMLRCGVLGYILKTAEENVLIEAIETVNNGGKFIEQSIKEDLNQFNLNKKREATLKATLTQREKEVLQLIVNGFSGQEIGEKLYLSEGTIKNYRLRILLKLDVNNTAALVKKALQLGLAE